MMTNISKVLIVALCVLVCAYAPAILFYKGMGWAYWIVSLVCAPWAFACGWKGMDIWYKWTRVEENYGTN